jgi:hypothetical protein
MSKRVFLAICGILLAFLFLGSTAAAADKESGGETAEFEMREVSVFEKTDITYRPLTRGASVSCSNEPDKAVHAYPKLYSRKPLYGKLELDRNKSGGKSIEYYFVLDESGATPAEEKNGGKKPEEPTPEKSLLQSILEKLMAAEKANKPKGTHEKNPNISKYNRLILDVNRDLDLTNDPVVRPMQDPKSLADSIAQASQVFDYLDLDVDYGPGTGVRPFRVLPYFVTYEYDHTTHSLMNFLAPTARKGRIKIGNHEYDALLAQSYVVSGRFDRPWTSLYLKPVDPEDKLASHGFAGDSLKTAYQIDGQLYTFSATPLGDKLIVKPYRGDYGILKIGPGGRDIKDLSISGSLRSENMDVGFGPNPVKPGEMGKEESEYKLPVGDYYPTYLWVKFGRLQVGLSDNYHLEGGGRSYTLRPRTFFIKIRKDEPFTFDFSNTPKVLFASLPKDATYKPGDQIEVKAVLIDPVCDFMIRDLDDTTRKSGNDGNHPMSGRAQSLAPLVTIMDSAGKKVSEGTMPFG